MTRAHSPGRKRCVRAHTLLEVREFVAAPCITATPFEIVMSQTHPAMKARPGPVADSCDKAVFDRIHVDVVGATSQVGLVPHHMLEKTSLPDGVLIALSVAFRSSTFRISMLCETASEKRFDLTQASRVVIVVRRQFHDHVKVIRQKDHGDDVKFEPGFHRVNGLSKTPTCVGFPQDWPSLIRHDSEKERATLSPPSPVVAHTDFRVVTSPFKNQLRVSGGVRAGTHTTTGRRIRKPACAR